MKIDKSLREDYAVLTLKGEFDTFYCVRFQEEVESLLEQGLTHIILNMRLVKFINSTALGAIIRAHKRCDAADGALLVSQPSQFVKKVISSLGIDQLISLFDDEDAAIKHVVQLLNAREFTSDAPVEEEHVLVTFPDDIRTQQLGGRKTVVGKMCNVDGQRLQFLWSGDRYGLTADQSKQLFVSGSDIRLKFQVKLIKKGFFEVKAKVSQTADADDNQVRVTADYSDIDQSNADALTQYAKDMRFLKDELPRA